MSEIGCTSQSSAERLQPDCAEGIVFSHDQKVQCTPIMYMHMVFMASPLEHKPRTYHGPVTFPTLIGKDLNQREVHRIVRSDICGCKLPDTLWVQSLCGKTKAQRAKVNPVNAHTHPALPISDMQLLAGCTHVCCPRQLAAGVKRQQCSVYASWEHATAQRHSDKTAGSAVSGLSAMLHRAFCSRVFNGTNPKP
jgi:hypothetical protein